MPDNHQAYKWEGINKQGKRTSGIQQATDINAAQAELKKVGMEIISIKAANKLSMPIFGGKQKVKMKDILLFTRFLSTMLAAGLPILQAIDVIEHDQENLTMRSLLLHLRSNIAGGQTLTESFRKYPNHFSNLYCSLISAGEKSGTLDKILNRLATYLEKTDTIKRKVKKALIYPIAIIVVSIIVSAILLIFVVPQFQTIFTSFGAQLPYFTRVVVGLSDGLRSYWWVFLAVIVGVIFGLRYMIRHNENFSERVDRFKLKLPVVGVLIQKGIIARYTRTLAITIEAGMPIVEAMRSMADVMDNRIYRKAVLQIANDLVNGHQLNIAMHSTKLFPNMAVQMIAVGEASGMLGDMLNKLADYYEEDVGHIVDNLSNLLEPLIMVLLGVIIGGFVVAMYLPIFKIGSIVK
jgi:type IV pilus assembly protein PilC